MIRLLPLFFLGATLGDTIRRLSPRHKVDVATPSQRVVINQGHVGDGENSICGTYNEG